MNTYLLVLKICLATHSPCELKTSAHEFKAVNDTAAYLIKRLGYESEVRVELFREYGWFHVRETILRNLDKPCGYRDRWGRTTDIVGTGAGCRPAFETEMLR